VASSDRITLYNQKRSRRLNAEELSRSARHIKLLNGDKTTLRELSTSSRSFPWWRR